MKNSTRIATTTTMAVGFLLSGCIALHGPNKSELEQLHPLASHATKLLGKVNGEVLRGTKQGTDIMTNIQKRYPEALIPFEDYRVFADNQDGEAFVLICDLRENIKYIEDAKCTTQVDYIYHQGKEHLECSFSKKEDVCQ